MPASPVSLALATGGGLLVYSGLTGQPVGTALRSILAGKQPAGKISSASPYSGASTPGGTPSVSSAGAVSGSGSQNYLTIANYLVGNGYSKAAAAGIVGCIAGESRGNPEATGDLGTSFGLIQEHGSQYSGLVTGNASADLDAQMAAILAYNNAQGAGLVQMLNAQTDPVQAAWFYSIHFERPLIPGSDVNGAVARSVYAQISQTAPY